jgi:hypothetical protein
VLTASARLLRFGTSAVSRLPILAPRLRLEVLFLLLCSNHGEKLGITRAQRNHDARVLGVADRNWNKSGAIYRGFRYGLVENLEACLFYLLCGFKS